MNVGRLPKSILSSSSFDRLWLGLCLLVSGAIMLSFMAKSSIWHDEGYSLLLAPQQPTQIIERTARDVHPPAYYLALHGWMNLFGQSEMAARSLSMVAVLLAMAVMFLLIRRLFGSGAAKASILLLALAPFLIRYGQEARMYALVAMLVVLATYLLVTALDNNSRRRLLLYILVMTAAFYTHYYTVFMVVVHWAYVAWRTQWRGKRSAKSLDLKNWRWWAANASIILLFAPWLPAAYAQFSRVQGGFWISEVTLYTLPSTIAQFLHFTSFVTLPPWLRLGIPLLIIGLIIVAWRDRPHRRSLWLLASWAWLAPAAVWLVSVVSRPVYIDRYFVFAAIAFYPLLAVLLYLEPLNRWRTFRWLAISGLVLVLVSGVNNVYKQSNHRMRDIGQIVSSRADTGDRVIAGELYVYLDFGYYNQTGQPLYLYAPNGINGYGETSLIYDRPELVIKNYQQLDKVADSVWVVGKAGDKDYFRAIPSQWILLESYQSGESVARRYQTPDDRLVLR